MKKLSIILADEDQKVLNDMVKIFTDEEINWTLDGELAQGQQEIHVENLHHAIRLIQRVN